MLCSAVAWRQARSLGLAGSLVLGRFADMLGGRMKAMIITLNVLSTLAFLWFTLICINVAPSDTVYLYLSLIIGGLFISATTPIYYELAVESVYPIAEGVTTGLVTTANNVGCLVFLLLPYSKMVHGLYRGLALLKAAKERKAAG